MGSFAAVRAIAAYLPPKIEKNDMMDERFLKKIGIRERHIVDKECASDLAQSAAETLLARYDIDRTTIDFVLFCTQQPDYLMPTTACVLQGKLGLSKQCGALDYNLGCSGYVYGLMLAKGLVETGAARNLLLITTGLYTHFANPKDGVTRPIFGDGATATLITAKESEQPFLHSFVYGTDGARYDRLIIPAGGSKNPPRRTPEKFITDDQGYTRSNYDATMDGQAIAFFTLREVPPLVEQVLEKSGLSREQLDYCVFHQPNKFMLEYVQQKCQLTGVPFYNDVEMTGNTVSSTIPIGLEKIFQHTAPEELHHVMLAGFGVGLSWAGCIADFSQVMSPV